MKPRITVDRATAFAWIAPRRETVTPREIAEQFGCHYGTGWKLLRAFDTRELRADAEAAKESVRAVPLPRWTQPLPPPRHFNINDAYPERARWGL